MLKKLLKYDIKDIYKVLIYFYLLAIFSSIITRILFSIENSTIFNILAQISSGFTIAMIANILINNLMRIWVRFKNNFYNDEAYLTHTLPVSKNNLYLSKFLAQITTIFTSILIIIITLFIAYYSKENIEILKNILLPIANVYNSTIINIILIAIIFLYTTGIFFILFIKIINPSLSVFFIILFFIRFVKFGNFFFILLYSACTIICIRKQYF